MYYLSITTYINFLLNFKRVFSPQNSFYHPLSLPNYLFEALILFTLNLSIIN